MPRNCFHPHRSNPGSNYKSENWRVFRGESNIIWPRIYTWIANGNQNVHFSFIIETASRNASWYRGFVIKYFFRSDKLSIICVMIYFWASHIWNRTQYTSSSPKWYKSATINHGIIGAYSKLFSSVITKNNRIALSLFFSNVILLYLVIPSNPSK